MPEHPLLQMLIVAAAGWVNREQLAVIDYLREENRVLRELIGTRHPRLNDDQRRRLAAKGKAIGRRLLAEVASIVQPETMHTPSGSCYRSSPSASTASSSSANVICVT